MYSIHKRFNPATFCAAGGILLFLLISVVPEAVADTIYLKDGKTLSGMIDATSSDENKVVIRTANATLHVPRANIESIDQYPNISYTEASGDLAASEKDLDRAMELYQKAMANETGSKRLKEKIASLKQLINQRDQQYYGALFSQVQQAIQAQKYDEAIDLARRQLDRVKEPSAKARFQKMIAQAQLAIARQYRNHIQYPEAENHYSLAMQAYPEGAEARLELADMLQQSPARKTAAIPLYEEGVRLAEAQEDQMDPEAVLGYRFRLGQLYFDEKNYAKAANVFLEVTRKDAKFRYPQAVDMAVESYAKMQSPAMKEDLEKVIQNLQAIILIKPGEERAYLLLGRLYFDQSEWAKARDNLEMAVKNAAQPEQSLALQEALYYLGISYRRLGQIDQAAQAFQRLVNLQSSNYDALCELAEIRLEQMAYTSAKDLFQKALDLDKEKYRAYLGLGRTLQKMQQYSEARENFKAVVEHAPDHPEAQLAIAQTYAEEKNWDETSRAAQKAVDVLTAAGGDKEGSENKAALAQALTLMGTANLNLQSTHTARDFFEKALAVIPDYAEAFDGIGKTYQADGLHKNAEEYFLKAIQADPKNPDYYLSLAVNWHKYRMSGEKALPYYYEYLKLGGKDPNVRTWITECGGTPPPAS